MLLTTHTYHGRLYLQVERSVLGRSSRGTHCQVVSKQQGKRQKVNPLAAMSIYIYTRTPTAHRDEHIYTHTVQTSAYRAELQSQTDRGVNPCLLSSNKFRPHLSTYITTRKRQEGAVLMCEWSWILTRASKSEAFSRTNGANSLQFSLKAEVLPSNNLEKSRNCQGCR